MQTRSIPGWVSILPWNDSVHLSDNWPENQTIKCPSPLQLMISTYQNSLIFGDLSVAYRATRQLLASAVLYPRSSMREDNGCSSCPRRNHQLSDLDLEPRVDAVRQLIQVAYPPPFHFFQTTTSTLASRNTNNRRSNLALDPSLHRTFAGPGRRIPAACR